MFEDRYNRARFPINPGVPVVFQLPQGGNILRGNIIIDATVTISGSTAAGVAVGEGGPANLIRRVKVLASKAAGSRYLGGALVNCSPRSLLRYAINQRSGKFLVEQSGSTLGNGANGVYDIYMSIPIYFEEGPLQAPQQTALNMNALDSQGNPIYSSVQVQVEMAEFLTEIFNGNNGALTVAGMCEWDDDRLMIGATGIDTLPMKQEDHYAIIQAANEEFVDPAMPNDGAFTTWLLMTEQGEPGQTLADTILNRLEIRGTGLNFKQQWQDIRQYMIDEGWYDPSTNMAGQFFIDWTRGSLRNSNAASTLQHLMSLNNPSGAGLDRLRVYTRRIYGLPNS